MVAGMFGFEPPAAMSAPVAVTPPVTQPSAPVAIVSNAIRKELEDLFEKDQVTEEELITAKALPALTKLEQKLLALIVPVAPVPVEVPPPAPEQEAQVIRKDIAQLLDNVKMSAVKRFQKASAYLSRSDLTKVERASLEALRESIVAKQDR
jgi:hypothetical protein